jgi:hypothetical protein
MKKFKDFIKNIKENNEKLNVLSWDGHEFIRDKIKNKPNVLSWDGHEFIRDKIKPIKESQALSDDDYDHEFHDHPDIKANHLSDDQKAHIKNYSFMPTGSSLGHSSSKNINGYLRNKEGDKDSKILHHKKEDVHAAVKNLSSCFTPENTNKREIVVHSGVPEHIGKTLKQSGKGSQHHIAGFTSTSSTREVALNVFAKQYDIPKKEHHIIKYRVEPGAGLSIAPHSKFPGEDEVLLHHGAKITYHGTISKKQPDGSIVHEHHATVHNEHKPLEHYGEYTK